MIFYNNTFSPYSDGGFFAGQVITLQLCILTYPVSQIIGNSIINKTSTVFPLSI